MLTHSFPDHSPILPGLVNALLEDSLAMQGQPDLMLIYMHR